MSSAPLEPPRWLHRWALLTVCAALPLLLLGAEVTTKGVGMVDARGLRPPWHFFQVFMEDKGLGWMIEHGHRLAGFVVGTCVIVLAASLWRSEPRRWVRWLGVAVLAGICLQGSLGIFRIELNAVMGKGLALVHGCFAQVIFCLLVCLALLTSRSWMDFHNRSLTSGPVRSWSLVTCCLVFAQLVMGSVVRHQDQPLAARAHLLLAFGVVAAILWLAKLVLETPGLKPRIGPLLGLVALQLFLGVEAWLSKFFTSASPWRQLEPLALHPDLLRSLHYVTGTLIFAATVVIALYAHHPSGLEVPAEEPAGRLEGVGMKTSTEAIALPRSRVADYLELTKPRIAFLVLFTVAAGALLASHSTPDLAALAHTLIGTALVAGGASALNQLLERHSDALMRRTESRPLPSGRLQPMEVLLFGLVLGLTGLIYLAISLRQPVCVLVAGFTFISYVLLYTPLKRKTTLNTLVGAVPGALPPVIGWTAMGGTIGPEVGVLFALLFLWQVPHFLAIAWIYREDYARAGLRMLPVVDETGSMTARQMVSYCLALIPVSLSPVLFRQAGWFFALAALFLGFAFLAASIGFMRRISTASARRVLHASLIYLPILFALLLLENVTTYN